MSNISRLVIASLLSGKLIVKSDVTTQGTASVLTATAHLAVRQRGQRRETSVTCRA